MTTRASAQKSAATTRAQKWAREKWEASQDSDPHEHDWQPSEDKDGKFERCTKCGLERDRQGHGGGIPWPSHSAGFLRSMEQD